MIFNSIAKLGSLNNDAHINSVSMNDNNQSILSYGNSSTQKFQWKPRWTTYKSVTLYQPNTEYY